jgi:hypothetical protein
MCTPALGYNSLGSLKNLNMHPGLRALQFVHTKYYALHLAQLFRRYRKSTCENFILFYQKVVKTQIVTIFRNYSIDFTITVFKVIN